MQSMGTFVPTYNNNNDEYYGEEYGNEDGYGDEQGFNPGAMSNNAPVFNPMMMGGGAPAMMQASGIDPSMLANMMQ